MVSKKDECACIKHVFHLKGMNDFQTKPPSSKVLAFTFLLHASSTFCFSRLQYVPHKNHQNLLSLLFYNQHELNLFFPLGVILVGIGNNNDTIDQIKYG